jgi:glycosyltransferase involved in cell wall biosynthesis
MLAWHANRRCCVYRHARSFCERSIDPGRRGAPRGVGSMRRASEAGRRRIPQASGMRRERVLVVSPRPPRLDGQGDQRRAYEIVTALSSEWPVEVVSWLPDVTDSDWRRWGANRLHLVRAAGLSIMRPAAVAYVQSRAPQKLSLKLLNYDAVVFVTDRAVPRRIPPVSVIDFVDDLGAGAFRRASSSKGLKAAFWRLEGIRVRRLDRVLARTARLCAITTPADAKGIAPNVRPIPLSVGTRPSADSGERVAFFGNLFYAPNHEAAMWICNELAPSLQAHGVDPEAMLIAGRRPHPALVKAAERAGVELRADVEDLKTIIDEAAVVVAPMTLGSGSQYKVLDAVGAGRPCVLSPVANTALGFVDGSSALVRERAVAPFAEAIAQLLGDPQLRSRLREAALTHIAPYSSERVGEAWRSLLRELFVTPTQVNS